ncbi:MAG: TlpA family protein disulfide reductase [Cyclobacteriaceae bacterium]|nr:TlpA family protein disulfide reductase [Cyclobacteriaceae bacterium]
MFKRIFDWLKPIAAAVILLAALQLTGLLSSVSFYTQTAALETGILDATTTPDKTGDTFNFGFVLKDMQGNRVNFDDYKGKVVFLNMWATWCGPCRAEMPAIQKLYESVQDPKIAFVMLSIDTDDKKDKVLSYVKKNNYTFPIFMPSGQLPDQLRVPSIPTTFLISKEGKVILKEVGTTNYNTKKFRELLKSEASK